MEIVKQLVADAYIAGTIAFQNGSYSTLIDVGTVKGPLVQIKKSAIDLDVLLTSIQNELKRQLDLI